MTYGRYAQSQFIVANASESWKDRKSETGDTR